MKPFSLFLLLFAFLLFGFQSTDSGDVCNAKELRLKCKPMLAPFAYDSSKIMHIHFGPKNQRREVEVPLFFGEKYRLVFTSVSLQQPVIVEIYKKDYTHEKRELLFTSKDENGKDFSFEPPRGMKVFVDYLIPAAQDPSNTTEGCVAFLLGYK